jgi:hypothetical protein
MFKVCFSLNIHKAVHRINTLWQSKGVLKEKKVMAVASNSNCILHSLYFPSFGGEADKGSLPTLCSSR